MLLNARVVHSPTGVGEWPSGALSSGVGRNVRVDWFDDEVTCCEDGPGQAFAYDWCCGSGFRGVDASLGQPRLDIRMPLVESSFFRGR